MTDLQHLRSFLLGLLILLQLTSTFHVLAASPSDFESDISWPQAVDDFDQHLINLVRARRQADIDEEDAPIVSTSTTPAPVSNGTKNFTIDWAEVERNWVKVLSEEEVGQKWNEMETKLKNGKGKNSFKFQPD